MIFHHPEPLHSAGLSGSAIRPRKMIEAFTDLGYVVDTVVGYGAERKKSIEKVKQHILETPQAYAFAYVESSTTPIWLTEKHHFPTYPTLDFRFLHMLKTYGIPVGLFYRDAYWRSEQYADFVPLHQRVIMVPAYHLEWLAFRTVADVLFLPSLAMEDHLPQRWHNRSVYPLPPGCNDSADVVDKLSVTSSPHLHLLYVGGVSLPFYDLREMLSAIGQLPTVKLTICCRQQEWANYKNYYKNLLTSNIQVVHAHGKELSELYYASDLSVYVSTPTTYLGFAMPVKVFEALSHHTPMIIAKHIGASALVTEENIGWAVSSATELKGLLEHLLQHRNEIQEKYESTVKAHRKHTWKERARFVEHILWKEPS